MYIIDQFVILDEVIENQFVCNLEACKGACCWEGDYGAPLEEEELDVLDAIYENIKPLLSSEAIQSIEKEGRYVYVEEEKEFATPLLENAACAYLIFEDNGIAKCALEKANEMQLTDFPKPISCHLYPIRIESMEHSLFKKIRYDQWDICSAACENGLKLEVQVFEFLKKPLIRKFGAEFYERLEDIAKYHKKEDR